MRAWIHTAAVSFCISGGASSGMLIGAERNQQPKGQTTAQARAVLARVISQLHDESSLF